MTPIHISQDISLPDGYSEFEIDSERDLDLTFSCLGKADAFIRIVRSGKLRIHTYAGPDARAAYLFWNAGQSTLQCEESHEVMANASLKIAYGECNQADTERSARVALQQDGAQAVVSSASLVSSKKSFHMDVVSYAPHTIGEMQNYSVVLHGGFYRMEATGKIIKGAHGSQSHQTSRALCFDEGQTSTILPKLLIDEHDVQASHATSVGRVDEDQLYYMQSRGLTPKQVTGLISTGYLMPITEVLDDEQLKQKLKAELEGKIGQLCSM